MVNSMVLYYARTHDDILAAVQYTMMDNTVLPVKVMP